MVSVGRYHAAWVPITAGSGLLVGRGVVMVLRLGLWRLLELFFWMTYFLSLVTHLSLVSHWWYCSTNFSSKKPTWKLPPLVGVAALVAAVAVPRIFRTLFFLEVLEKVEGRGYDLPKRQMCVSVLGSMLGSSQFPNDGRLTL